MPDATIAALAARQHGYVTYAQLRAAGFGRSQVARRQRHGSLIRTHTGVYAVGHVPVTPESRAAAAVLACGPGAVLSHGSAAALWGFDDRWSDPPEVTVTGDRRRPRIRVHRCVIHRREIAVQRGIRVTSPARTVLDVAPRLSDRILTRMVNDALRSNYLRLDDLAELLGRSHGRPSAHRLAAWLDASPGPTRSQLEDDFVAFVRRFDLPEPQINVTVAGYEVDAFFPAQRVIVELDSWSFHRDRQTFEDDRERDATTIAAGCRTVRITDERLKQRPEREAHRLRTILRLA